MLICVVLLQIPSVHTLYFAVAADQVCNLPAAPKRLSAVARLSVHCVTRNELRLKPRTTSLSGDHSAHHHHSMGRALSVLLAEQQLIAPLTLYNAQQLTRRIEALSSQKRLLKAERETFRQRNDRARQRLEEMREEREALQQQLHSQRHRLEQERLELRTLSPQHLEQRDQRRQIVRQVGVNK